MIFQIVFQFSRLLTDFLFFPFQPLDRSICWNFRYCGPFYTICSSAFFKRRSKTPRHHYRHARNNGLYHSTCGYIFNIYIFSCLDSHGWQLQLPTIGIFFAKKRLIFQKWEKIFGKKMDNFWWKIKQTGDLLELIIVLYQKNTHCGYSGV